MNMVTLRCNDCATKPTIITFASDFEPHEATKIQDMQQHMDMNFKARCDSCFSCNWEVIDVYKGPRSVAVNDYIRT